MPLFSTPFCYVAGVLRFSAVQSRWSKAPNLGPRLMRVRGCAAVFYSVLLCRRGSAVFGCAISLEQGPQPWPAANACERLCRCFLLRFAMSPGFCGFRLCNLAEQGPQPCPRLSRAGPLFGLVCRRLCSARDGRSSVTGKAALEAEEEPGCRLCRAQGWKSVYG